MSVVLEGLKYRNFWVTRLGVLKACMEYLGKDHSDPWLFGATGHAFVLNVSEDCCVSGPTAWNCEMITHLAHNLGVSVNVLNGWKTEHDFKLKQKIAWENTKRALDKGLPCYGWELGLGEFYTICGYNEFGYLYKGIGTPTYRFSVEAGEWENLMKGVAGGGLIQAFADHGVPFTGNPQVQPHPAGYAVIRDGDSKEQFFALYGQNGTVDIHDDFVRHSESHRPWEELGTSDIGWLHTGWLEEGAGSDDFTTVLEALEFGLEMAGSPAKWVMPGYKAGLAGYDNWLNTLRAAGEGTDPTGLAYNGEVWAECRAYAGIFLEEAADRIGGEAGVLLRQAAQPYKEAAACLSRYRSLLPFFGRSPQLLGESGCKNELLQALEGARRAEEAGLTALRAAYICMEQKTES